MFPASRAVRGGWQSQFFCSQSGTWGGDRNAQIATALPAASQEPRSPLTFPAPGVRTSCPEPFGCGEMSTILKWFGREDKEGEEKEEEKKQEAEEEKDEGAGEGDNRRSSSSTEEPQDQGHAEDDEKEAQE
ncbi:major centromere autoantigen B-like isoform X2 [Numida meleagris]|uniref:major centromere autoantigen B-like isoform X2 n=1 Tax=Numida meleagris TaxID=8996 RepID=UPI000B3E0258|nr:major centromere autoantigen B-like isoform X2 [Numida meleagris]